MAASSGEAGGAPPFPRRDSSGAKRTLRSVWNVLLYLYVSVRHYLTAAWIRLNRRLLRTGTAASAARSFHHKVVVIGDGLALGAGDPTGGVAPHLRAKAEREPAVRRRWTVINRGEMGSTADMWLPPPSSLGGRDDGGGGGGIAPSGRRPSGGGLFERTFGPGRPGSDAEVVLIVMGTTDVCRGVGGLSPAVPERSVTDDAPHPASELAPLAKNVGAVAAALRAQGRRVCVVDLPTAGVPGTSRGTLRRLNRQLRQVVAGMNERRSPHSERGGDDEGEMYPVQYFSLGDNHALMRPEHRSFDLLYLNRKGYKQLAFDLFESGGVKEMMVGVEWTVWRSQFQALSKKTR